VFAGAVAVSGSLLIAGINGTAGASQSSRATAVPRSTAPFVVMAAGDISLRCGKSAGTRCASERTARIIEKAHPRFVLPLGDNQYDLGTIHSYDTYYATTWGRFKSISRPVPGNHESYDPAGSTSGYRAYFGKLAMPQGRSYYSFDSGNWHFVALDSTQSMAATSLQNTWLKSDLAANERSCVLAYWHHPQFSSGSHGENHLSRNVWRSLYAKRADLILNGHEHLYERFAPQSPVGTAVSGGIREFIVGTGGATLRAFDDIAANSKARRQNMYGVLKLTLADRSYRWEYIQDNGTVRDSGSASCH
jgi:hypothetical protein